MHWYRELKMIIAREPEVWLAYLYGQQLDKLPLLAIKKPRYRGLFLQILKYPVLLLRNVRLKKVYGLKNPARFFIFADSLNQMSSLSQTLQALKRCGEKVVAVGSPSLTTNKNFVNDYVPYHLTFVDAVRALLLFSANGIRLYRELKAKNPISVDWHFANFCFVYVYLAYFYRVLLQIKPKYVITANDHSAPNRCMLAVAHYLGIKTVYLQHASVSSLFPALRVNYAFLDGQCALDIYRQCEVNQPRTARQAPLPKVILSGQKKYVERTDKSNRNVVGVALNSLDSVKAGIEFVNALIRDGLQIRLRWHPAQPQRDIVQYQAAFADNGHVSLSDPHQEPISSFMGQISWLIAGNSSIHLEAALAGVMPIYFELMPSESPDYYGYVKRGLASQVRSADEVFDLVKNTRGGYSPNIKAIRYYSSTYLTEWEGREGELVAECLQRLAIGKELPIAIVSFGGKDSCKV